MGNMDGTLDGKGSACCLEPSSSDSRIEHPNSYQEHLTPCKSVEKRWRYEYSEIAQIAAMMNKPVIQPAIELPACRQRSRSVV